MEKRFIGTDDLAPRAGVILCVAAVIAILTTGCATIQSFGFEQPGFDVTSVRVDGLGFTGGSLTLLIDVDNPNAYDLRTGQIDVAIDFEGTRFGEAFLDGSTRFDARSLTPIEVPLSFAWEGVGAGARALLERGEVGYALATSLTVETPLGDRSVGVTTRGNASVRRPTR